MPLSKRWYFDPGSGEKKIPEGVKHDIVKRIEDVAEKHFKGKYTLLDIRFKGQFCYIYAYEEPEVNEGWPPEDWPETREEYIERLRNTPVHLCRLRYFGNDEWSYAFFTYSHDKYELCVFPDGSFFGKPEDAFLSAANLYLGGKSD
jgi:hypothetical protein